MPYGTHRADPPIPPSCADPGGAPERSRPPSWIGTTPSVGAGLLADLARLTGRISPAPEAVLLPRLTWPRAGPRRRLQGPAYLAERRPSQSAPSSDSWLARPSPCFFSSRLWNHRSPRAPDPARRPDRRSTRPVPDGRPAPGDGGGTRPRAPAPERMPLGPPGAREAPGAAYGGLWRRVRDRPFGHGRMWARLAQHAVRPRRSPMRVSPRCQGARRPGPTSQHWRAYLAPRTGRTQVRPGELHNLWKAGREAGRGRQPSFRPDSGAACRRPGTRRLAAGRRPACGPPDQAASVAGDLRHEALPHPKRSTSAVARTWP